MPTPNFVDLLLSPTTFNYSPQTTFIFAQTILFAVVICTFAYALAVLYYLFIAANTLTLPIQDALLSQPVFIQEPEKPNTIADLPLTNALKNSLRKVRKLRGEVISELAVYTHANRPISAQATISGDFDSTEEVIEKVMTLLDGIFRQKPIARAHVIVVKASFGILEREKLFTLDVSRDEFDFLKKPIEGMDMEYKMLQVGAHIQRHLFAEAQIL
jgi:hypothetical protein